MPDRRDDRNRTGGDGARDALVVEGPQVFARPAAPADDDDVTNIEDARGRTDDPPEGDGGGRDDLPRDRVPRSPGAHEAGLGEHLGLEIAVSRFGSETAGALEDRPQARDGRSRVLVVDDESSIRELLQKTLALAEYDVDVAPDGRAALERLRLGNYDLLIADLKMPGMDGLTLIREAKRLKTDLPVIIITGFSTESSAIEAVNLGVAGYLTKPFRVPQVLAAAARALGE